jgi:hypothetical protein
MQTSLFAGSVSRNMRSGRSERAPSGDSTETESRREASASFVAGAGGGLLDAAELRARVDRLPPDAVLDLRDLPAPEPMERILDACARLAPGGAVAARTPRFPRMLLSLLERRGLRWAALEEADGTGLVYAERPADE